MMNEIIYRGLNKEFVYEVGLYLGHFKWPGTSMPNNEYFTGTIVFEKGWWIFKRLNHITKKFYARTDAIKWLKENAWRLDRRFKNENKMG